MNQTESRLEGKRKSFFQLFQEDDYVIEIPVIQRDYAQGRASKSEVRHLFLEALYKYLEEGIPNRDLDFIYGSTEQETVGNENGIITKFIPLDGQQRLTTLFLLHWYLALAADQFAEFRQVLVRNKKSKFTYLTRTSSSEFCDALLNNPIDLSNLLPADKKENNSLSKTIKDCGWFFLSWELDPTIQSILVMLDAIHDKFKDKAIFYDRLINQDKPIVTFIYLDLGVFQLTEDLYIKMNSRGKVLTDYENFKAKFEQYISSVNFSEKKPFKIKKGEKVNQLSHKEYFSIKIDTKWSNIFWPFRKLVGNENTIDDELMNFIRAVVLTHHAAAGNSDDLRSLEYLIGTKAARKRADYKHFITFHQYEKLKVLSSDLVEYLIGSFDVLEGEGKPNKLKKYLPEGNFYYDEARRFENVLKFNLRLPQIIQFYAYLKFLVYNKNDASNLYQWMRFIHNITENTPIDESEDISRAVQSIEKIIPYSKNILEFLRDPSCEIDFFFGRQIQEEKIKAVLIKSDQWKTEIEIAEQNRYFSGQILFLLEFSGILKSYESNPQLDWSNEDNEMYLQGFINYRNKAYALFKLINTDENKDYLVERAVLTKGNYAIEISYDRFNLLSTSKNKRDYSWNRLLRLPPLQGVDRQIWLKRRGYVKEVLDDELFDQSNVINSLKKIINNKPANWRKYFIKNPDLIRYCSQGFIKIPSGNPEHKILLFMHTQTNHRHRDLYTYNFYLNFIKSDERLFLPFEEIWHQEITVKEDDSGIYFSEWCYKRIHYELCILKNKNDEKFSLYFYKAKGDQHKESFNRELVEELEKQRFKWSTNDNSFIVQKKEKDLLEFMINICHIFKQLS